MCACTMIGKFGYEFVLEERNILYIMMLNVDFWFDECGINGLVMNNLFS